MAKTQEQIIQEITDSIQISDSSLDAQSGPIPDIVSRPVAVPLAEASVEAENTRTLFTLNFADTITDEEARLALGNFGSSPGEGRNAQVTLYFMRFTRPTSDIPVAAGSLTANSDNTLVYRTLTTVTMLVSAADSYYNASRGAWEISVQAEAVGAGTEYELPAYRITNILTPVAGIDSVENRSRASGGVAVETLSQQSARLQQKMQGLNLGAPSGMISRIQDSFSGVVTDVSVVQPFDPEFARLVTYPSIDLYLMGQLVGTQIDTFTAIGGETIFTLTKQPALSISTVTVNGTAAVVDYELVLDTSAATGYSLDANDALVLGTPAIAGDVIEVTYSYNSLLEQVNTEVFADSASNLFNTTSLIRSPFPIHPVVRAEIKILPSYSTTEVEQSLTAFNEVYWNPSTFVTIVYPSDYRDQLLSDVPGVASVRITSFHRNTGSNLEVEPIQLGKNEKLVYDSSLVALRIVR